MEQWIDSMRERVLRHADSPATDTAIPRLTLSIVTAPSSGVATVFAPVTCLILQGTKRITIGGTTLDHDASNHFMASLDVPATGEIADASAERPYLGLGLTLDRAVLADLIAALPAGLIGCGGAASEPGFALGDVTQELLEAWAGLLALLDRPEDIPALAPAREREILYRLLRSPLGGQLCRFAQEDGRLARIRRAIACIRARFAEPLPVAMLAEVAGMSLASFHRHFRAATAMSPLDYQKTLRLHAARRLLASGMEASRAGHAVGYASASQFSREYRRAFGAPPSRYREAKGVARVTS